MTLQRAPEPELMDQPEQARAYAGANFAVAHDRFVAEIGRRFGLLRGDALDLGCGPADPTVRLVRANPALAVVAVDAGPVMLSLARERIEREGLSGRIHLERRRLPDPSLAGRRFDLIVSNSLLHHLPDPLDLWRAVAGCAQPGAAVAVMDLLRPPDLAAVDRLVAEHAGTAPPVLKADFRNSLLAAYRVGEVERQLAEAGLGGLSVEALDDHHLFVAGRLG